jgi:hypothetical protein
MGMSTHAIGFKGPDDKWRQMKAVWDACEDAHIDPPPKVRDYFEGERPDGEGVAVSEADLVSYGAVREWSNDMREGFDIVVSRIPADVTTIRVYNAW